MIPAPFDLVAPSAYRHRHLESGETVFRQDEKARGLFYVLDGQIELRRYTQNGQNVVIHRASNGQTFAEASLFAQNYHCDAIAIAPSRLVELDRAVILKKFVEDADFSLALAKRFAGQIRGYRRKLEILAIRSAEDRIFAAIEEGQLNGSIKAFATDIALTHEAVYRGLATLVDKGLLEKTGRGKYVVRPEK